MTKETLDQDEIDALLNGVGSGAVTTDARPVGDAAPVRAYDFSTQTRIVRGRMLTLEMINERLARALRQSIFDMIRQAPEVSAQAISTPKYAEYIQMLSLPTSLNLIRFQPLSGTGLMVFESKLVFAIIDAFFGGCGRQTRIDGRDFTPTEVQIIHLLMEQVIAGIEEAWKPVMKVNVDFLSREVNPGFANIVSPTEIVVVSTLRVTIDGRGGDINIALPYSMLEPIKDMLRAGIQSDGADRAERWAQVLRNELEECDVRLVTRMGTIEMSVSSLLDMCPGDVLPCDFDGRVVVSSDDVPLFSGKLGQQRGQRVVEVDQLSVRKSTNLLDMFVRKHP